MADFLLRDIDERVAERIKELARQKGWPLNDVILHLVKQSLAWPSLIRRPCLAISLVWRALGATRNPVLSRPPWPPSAGCPMMLPPT